MPARRIARAISPLLTFVDWLFSSLVPVVDAVFGALAVWWLFLMLAHSEIFDRGNFQGLQWLPDRLWIVFLVVIAALHLFGLVRIGVLKLRILACLLSAWFWLLVAVSLSRLGWSAGFGSYGIYGILALVAAVYLSSPHRPVD